MSVTEEIHKKMGYKYLPPEVEEKIQSLRKKEQEILDMIKGMEQSSLVQRGEQDIQIGFMCLRKSISEGAIQKKQVIKKEVKWTSEGLEKRLKMLEGLIPDTQGDSIWLDEQISLTKQEIFPTHLCRNVMQLLTSK